MTDMEEQLNEFRIDASESYFDFHEELTAINEDYKQLFTDRVNQASKLLDSIPSTNAFLACRSYHQIERSRKKGGDKAKELRWKRKANSFWNSFIVADNYNGGSGRVAEVAPKLLYIL